MIDTVAVDGWAVTSGTARRVPPINGQCTKFDVALYIFASGVKRVKIVFQIKSQVTRHKTCRKLDSIRSII